MLYCCLNCTFAGELLRVKKLFSRTVEECLVHYDHVGNKDIAFAAAFIRRCLTIDPSARLELLQDKWLNGI